MQFQQKQHSQILSLIPGRVRIHLPAWVGDASTPLEEALTSMPGIHSVEANPITRNVLVRFDPQILDPESILFCLQPFGSLEEVEDEVRAMSLVEQIRMGMTLLRLVGQLRSSSPVSRTPTSLAIEVGFFVLTLLFDHLAVPQLGIRHLPLLLDLLAFGTILAPRIPQPALALSAA